MNNRFCALAISILSLLAIPAYAQSSIDTGIGGVHINGGGSSVNVNPDGSVYINGGGSTVQTGPSGTYINAPATDHTDHGDERASPRSNRKLHTPPALLNPKSNHQIEPAGRSYTNSNLHNTQFDGQRLMQVSFVNADLTNISFRNADLRGADFSNVTFNGGDLRGALVDGANFTNATFNGTNIAGVDFSRATMVNVDGLDY